VYGWRLQEFFGCQCIEDGRATAGLCTQPCMSFYVFIVVIFVTFLCKSMMIVPIITVLLRYERCLLVENNVSLKSTYVLVLICYLPRQPAICCHYQLNSTRSLMRKIFLTRHTWLWLFSLWKYVQQSIRWLVMMQVMTILLFLHDAGHSPFHHQHPPIYNIKWSTVNVYKIAVDHLGSGVRVMSVLNVRFNSWRECST